MTELQTGHCHLKAHPFKLVLIKSPEWQMQADNWRGLTHSLWLSSFYHINLYRMAFKFRFCAEGTEASLQQPFKSLHVFDNKRL
jgi:hypothetical protein